MPPLRMDAGTTIPVRYRKCASSGKPNCAGTSATRPSLLFLSPPAGKSVRSHAPTIALPSLPSSATRQMKLPPLQRTFCTRPFSRSLLLRPLALNPSASRSATSRSWSSSTLPSPYT